MAIRYLEIPVSTYITSHILHAYRHRYAIKYLYVARRSRRCYDDDRVYRGVHILVVGSIALVVVDDDDANSFSTRLLKFKFFVHMCRHNHKAYPSTVFIQSACSLISTARFSRIQFSIFSSLPHSPRHQQSEKKTPTN